MKTVLIIDDDKALADLLAKALEKHGYHLIHAGCADEGLRELVRVKPLAVLLDVNLPGISGLDLCREIRKRNHVPIIMISALGETSDRIVGLEIGADSYLPKPFEPRELVAHLEAVLRRVNQLSGTAPSETITLGDLEVDLGKRQVTLSGSPIEISTAEFELLKVFISAPGHVFNRDELLTHLRGIDWDAYNRSIDVLISRLRRRLRDDSKRPRFIKTVWGAGYTFIPQESARRTG